MSKLFQMDIPLCRRSCDSGVASICEELLFRGFLMRFFEGKSFVYRSGQRRVFAIFHLDPFRLPPTFLLEPYWAG